MADQEGAQPAPANLDLLWLPKNVEGHRLEIFREKINRKYGLHLRDYFDLHRWSVDKYGEFWLEAWLDAEVVCSKQPEEPVIDPRASMDSIPRWFTGAKLNYAENLLRYPDDDKVQFPKAQYALAHNLSL